MRSRSVVYAVIALSAVTATVAARRLGAWKRRAAQRPVPARPVFPAVPGLVATEPAAGEAVVLPFTRPAVAEPATPVPVAPVPAAPVPAAPVPAAPVPAALARCGDTGGRTKAGAPCAARATADGRCHHHRLAA
jgi:hypothetical protein